MGRGYERVPQSALDRTNLALAPGRRTRSSWVRRCFANMHEIQRLAVKHWMARFWRDIARQVVATYEDLKV